MIARFASIPKWLQVGIALVCVFFILYVCIAPNIDLPDTTLRGLQMAMLLLSLIALVVAVQAALMVQMAARGVERAPERMLHYSARSKLLLLCTQTC
jgi:hypothetical protein